MRPGRCGSRKQSSPMAGSTPSPRKCSVEVREWRMVNGELSRVADFPYSLLAIRYSRALRVAVTGCALMAGGARAETALAPYRIVGDAIPASLTGMPGDPEQGRKIVSNRQ